MNKNIAGPVALLKALGFEKVYALSYTYLRMLRQIAETYIRIFLANKFRHNLCGSTNIRLMYKVDECSVDKCLVDKCLVDKCLVNECLVDECSVAKFMG
jgi:hypothetical protein